MVRVDDVSLKVSASLGVTYFPQAETIDADKARAMAEKMAKGKFDLNDLAEQIKQMQAMGGMGGIMGMMPGMAGMKDKISAAGLDDKVFKRQLAIISSMTRAERANPDILKHSRKKRIAAGSGTDASDINKLLKMHRQMADMMKAMGGKKGGGMMKQMMGGLASKMGLGGGMGGMGMPDLSKMDPKQLEALAKQGIVVLAASGNSYEERSGNDSGVGYPSSDSWAMSIGSVIACGESMTSVLSTPGSWVSCSTCSR